MSAPGIHVISHTHWDREWYLTFEQYRGRLIDLVDGVLDRMTADPRFTYFHLDGQTVVLEDYLEVRPEREAELRRRVGEGRLLIGPWYVMPDMFLVSGEALVRNLARGIRIATAFGGAMRVGYIPDPFGHVAQMPQILAGFGLQGAILWRGFAGPNAEYVWEAPDGSRVLLLHLPREGYCNGLRLPLLAPERRREEASALVARELERSASGQALLMVGVDHVQPHPALLQVVDAMTDGRTDGGTARLSTLPDYVDAVTATLGDGIRDLDIVRGELRGGEEYAHLLPGVLSARTYLKQANSRVQREIEQWAEPMSAFALLCGRPVPPGMLGYAWRTLLQNHPHDSICGCSIDDVHEENMTRFARALQAAQAVTDRAVRDIGARVPPAPAGSIRCLLVNTNHEGFSGIVEGTVEIPIEPGEPGRDIDQSALEFPLVLCGSARDVLSVTDHDGRPLAFQVMSAADAVSYRMSRYSSPVPIRVRRLQLAVAVDSLGPLGYAVVDVGVAPEAGSGTPPPARAWIDGNALENEWLRVEPLGDGTVDVLDKRRGTRYSGVFTIEDVGDVGDEYNFSPPVNDRRIASPDAERVTVRALQSGPLVASLSVNLTLRVPAAASADRMSRSTELVQVSIALEIRLRAGDAAVACVARIDNRARDHRLRVLCPASAAEVTTHRADTAFGLVRRPARKSVPAGPLVETPVSSSPMQSFVDAGDGSSGAVIVAEGLMEYELVPAATGPSVALTLLRCVGDLSRDDLSTRKGHAGPGLPTPGAQCPGVHEFRFAFIPRGAPPDAGELFRLSRNLLAPPRLFSPCGGDATLPAAQSFIRADGSQGTAPVLSAFKVADERASIVMRMFNPADRPVVVRVTPSTQTAGIHRVDLEERRLEPCATSGGSAAVELGPHRIQTIEIVPGER